MSLPGDFFFSLSAPGRPCPLCAELPLTLAGLSLLLQSVTRVLTFCLCVLTSLPGGFFFFPFQLQVALCPLFPPVPSLDRPCTVLHYFSLSHHHQISLYAQPLLPSMSAPSHVKSGPSQLHLSPLLPSCQWGTHISCSCVSTLSLHSGECLSFHPCPCLLLTIDDLWLNSLDSWLSCPSTSPCDILLHTTHITLSILGPLSCVLLCLISVFRRHENTCQVPHRSNLTFIPAPVPIGSASVGDRSLPHCGERAHISCACVTTSLLHSGECLSLFPPPPL